MKIGLAVMRLQPMHMGHSRLIHQMIMSCDISIVGIGSAQNEINQENPWTLSDRIKMVKSVFGERVKILPLKDITFGVDRENSQRKDDWLNYVLDKIDKVGLPRPTDYFTGSTADSIWYKSYFKLLPTNSSDPVLHIIPRDESIYPSATELRTFIQMGSPEWKQWTPRVIHSIVEDGYPPEYKIN